MHNIMKRLIISDYPHIDKFVPSEARVIDKINSIKNSLQNVVEK